VYHGPSLYIFCIYELTTLSLSQEVENRNERWLLKNELEGKRRNGYCSEIVSKHFSDAEGKQKVVISSKNIFACNDICSVIAF
jgi:hypothetical protein